MFSDIQGRQTENGGTIPATMTVTQLKPDIVVINEAEKTVHILELTVPFEHNIKSRHIYKANKYAHFSRDITNYKATVISFEVGARGYLTKENEESLRKICSLCEEGSKFKDFSESISKLAILGSYLILTARK